MKRPVPFLLLILDGFGYQKPGPYNAITSAHTPHWDTLWEQYPHALIEGSGQFVGLPADQMGNSEVGHLNMGAGRVVYQDYTRVSCAIADGSFCENPTLLHAIEQGKKEKATLHILGLLSPGGVHSHEAHIEALIELAQEKGLSNISLHAILDGRDTPPKSAEPSLERIEKTLQQYPEGRIATVLGRYYAMDRDKRWGRIQKAYDAMTLGTGRKASSAKEALQKAYEAEETDEFVTPTVIAHEGLSPSLIKDKDIVVFMNFRADRARQLSFAFLKKDFSEFPRTTHPELSDFVTLTHYDDELPARVAYPPQRLTNTLSDVLAQHHLSQLHIAETEKYAHVTFFFNGGREEPVPGETRILIPSPLVATYDLKPEMSVHLITEELVKAITQQSFDVIICNFANADMVGHTGNFKATLQAIEAIDTALGHIMEALHKVGGEMLLTADHGNAECMFDETTGQAHTAHTCDPVPLCYFGRNASFTEKKGTLSDIAPTLLSLLGLPIPKEMTGLPLLVLS